MFQDFDLVVLDEVVLVAQRYRHDVLAAGHDRTQKIKTKHILQKGKHVLIYM
jgi:hypothetical protein